MLQFKISVSLLILRLSIAAFFGVWSSLKFFRPEWFENVFRNVYGLEFASRDLAWIIGVVQMALVLIFALGVLRVFSYAAVGLMQAAGVVGSFPNLMNFTGQLLVSCETGNVGGILDLSEMRRFARNTAYFQKTPAE